MDSPVFVEHTSLQGPVVCFLVRLCCGLGTPSSSNCVDCMLGCGVVRVIHEAVRKDSAVQDDATFASQIALVHVI